MFDVSFKGASCSVIESKVLKNCDSCKLKFLCGKIDMAEPAIRKAITVLDMLSRNPETVRLAELRMKKILDEKSMLEGAKEEGREEGREERREEGEKNKAIEVATEMLIDGEPIEKIIKYSKMTEKEIIELKSKIMH